MEVIEEQSGDSPFTTACLISCTVTAYKPFMLLHFFFPFAEEIVEMLKKFEAGPVVIQAAVNTLCQICVAQSTQKTYQVGVFAHAMEKL